jgi:hypothetical protein
MKILFSLFSLTFSLSAFAAPKCDFASTKALMIQSIKQTLVAAYQKNGEALDPAKIAVKPVANGSVCMSSTSYTDGTSTCDRYAATAAFEVKFTSPKGTALIFGNGPYSLNLEYLLLASTEEDDEGNETKKICSAKTSFRDEDSYWEYVPAIFNGKTKDKVRVSELLKGAPEQILNFRFAY